MSGKAYDPNLLNVQECATKDGPLHELLMSLTRQVREGEEWAIEMFLRDNPNVPPEEVELCHLQGNPYGYYVRQVGEGSEYD